ncbi:c-type cytochrome biogenesis protein CcsB [Nocardioides zeae]
MTSWIDRNAGSFSDGLVLSAIAVLSLALVAYAVGAALGRRGRARAEEGRVGAARSATALRRSVRARDAAGSAGSVLLVDAIRVDDGPLATDSAGERTARVGTSLTVLGVALTVLALVARGVAAGRAPWANMYEFALAGAASVGVVFLVALRRSAVRSMGAWIVALVLLLLGLAATVLYTPVDDLVPVLNSTWLVVHVASAIVAGGLFTVGFVATVVHLVRSAIRRRSAPLRSTDTAVEASDPFAQVASTTHLIAFPIWTFAVLAGAIWAENAWGRYWGWDPKETWAFITWVFYAAYLHADATTGRWARAAGWLAVAGFLAFVFNFFGVNIWLPGLHSYAGV